MRNRWSRWVKTISRVFVSSGGTRYRTRPVAERTHHQPSSRFILLRRPAVLHQAETPFVPEGADLDEVERRWAALCARNPAYFDGRFLHVIGVHRNGYGGAVLHVADCAYRFHAVQDASFDLGVRPLGTKGLVEREGRFLLGRRSERVAHYKSMWEFAPGGVVEPGTTPAETIITELYEETGLRASAEPTHLALIFDEVLRTWEIVFRLRVTTTGDEPPTSEYAELTWCAADDLPTPLSPVAEKMKRLILPSPSGRGAGGEGPE